MRQKLTVGLAAALLGLALTACGGSSAEPSSSPPQRPTRENNASGSSGASSGTSAATAAPAAASASAGSGGGTATGDALRIEKLNNGLENLSGYQLTFTTSVTPTAGGQVKTYTYDMTTTANGDQRIVFSAVGAAEAEMPLEMVTVDGTMFMLVRNGNDLQCISADASQTQGMQAPDDLLGAIDDAKLLESNVTVNGIATDHYQVVDPSLIFVAGDGTEVTADAWVARDGGYVVRYVGIVSGPDVAEGEDGTMSWTYDVTDVNRVDEITVPETCAAQQEATNALLPEGATNVMSFGNSTMFTTEDDVATMQKFYTDLLTAEGWSAGETVTAPGTAILNFRKDGTTMSVTITNDGSSTTVMVVQE